MIRIQYLKDAALAELKAHVPSNLQLYHQNVPFISEYFEGSTSWLCDSNLEVQSLPELKPSEKGDAEAENAILLHTAFKGITESQASDDRLWAWLAHGPYWQYMRTRWPVEKTKSEDATTYINEHFFIGGNVRNLVRHGIARLWWFAHMTYEPERQDPYELTKVMLEFSDNRQSLLERSFSRNKTIITAILHRLQHWKVSGIDILSDRDRFRALCKEINLYGGALQLDSLNDPELCELVDDFVNRTEAALQQEQAA